MTTQTSTIESEAEHVPTQAYPVGSRRFDWIMAGLSAWLIGGLYLDGWAHSHGRVDDVFFTPWHAILYSGVLVALIFLLAHQARNIAKGYVWQRALPQGYLLSLVGVVLFLAGGILDFVWHTLFGIEVNLETLLSPTHLLLAASGVLIISGPLRAAWVRSSHDEDRGWKVLGPPILSATLLLSIATFFTQFAHPVNEPYAGKIATLDQGGASDIYVMKADGSGQMRLTASSKMYAWGSTWSPDGRQLAFTRGEITAGDNTESALYLMNISAALQGTDGGDLKQLTDMPGQEYTPAWSPDGARIAFVSKVGQKQVLYVVNVDGSNLQPLTDGTSAVYGPAWSPDGARIVYTSNAVGSDQLYIMNSDGSHPTQLTTKGTNNWGAAWSPAGSQIAFNSSRDGNTDLYAISADGGGEQRLTDTPDDDYAPAWSPDGRQLAFISWRNDKADIYVINADGSDQHNLTDNHALEIIYPQWSPDGKTITFTAQGHTTLPNPYNTKSLAIVSVLLQTALLMGVVLMLVRHWRLPFGALTLLFTLNGLLMSVFNDQYVLVLSLLGAGLIADILLWRLKPAVEQPWHFLLFAFTVPVTLYALYFFVLQMTQGIDWTIHLWLGAIFMAGIIGLFIGFLTVSPWHISKEIDGEQD